MQLLLEAGADANIVKKGTNMTPLHWAAYNGDEGVIKALLYAEADVNIFSHNMQLPIDIAGSGKKNEVIDVFMGYFMVKHNITQVMKRGILQTFKTIT